MGGCRSLYLSQAYCSRETLFSFVYVDDIVLIGDKQSIHDLKKKILQRKFRKKDLGIEVCS